VCVCVCVVGAVSCAPALRHLPAGVQPGVGRRAGPADRAALSALPDSGRARLGVWHRHVQDRALPLRRQHVHLHLPDHPDERRPLAGHQQALRGTAAAHQAGTTLHHSGVMGAGLLSGTAYAFLPQVCVCVCVCVCVWGGGGSVSVCAYLCVYLSVCVCLSVYALVIWCGGGVYVCVCVFLCVYL